MLILVESLRIEDALRSELKRIGAAMGRADGNVGDISSILAALRLYLKFARDVARVAPELVLEETVVAACVEIRRQLTLLRSALGESPKFGQCLAELIDELPSSVPGKESFRFTHWVGFPHALRWSRLMESLVGQRASILEVGSFEGRSACWLLENVLTHPESTLTCVDSFHDSYLQAFEHNVAQTGAAKKVSVLRGASVDVLPAQARQSFDVVYLDAASAANDELTDCVLAWRLLKPGGLLICDDYGGDEDWEPGVTQALDAFREVFASEAEIVDEAFQLCLRKRVSRAAD